MSEYDVVQKSSLKLKGVAESGIVISKKKKKSKKHKEKKDNPKEEEERRDSVPSKSTDVDNYYKAKTKAEIEFLKRKEKLDSERIKKKASVSHKERVEKFNEYLNNLSEHYEPAKVSWTK